MDTAARRRFAAQALVRRLATVKAAQPAPAPVTTVEADTEVADTSDKRTTGHLWGTIFGKGE
jgi:hypothetical protein